MSQKINVDKLKNKNNVDNVVISYLLSFSWSSAPSRPFIMQTLYLSFPQ